MQITFSSHMATVPAAKMLSCSCLQSLNKKKKIQSVAYMCSTLPGYHLACVVMANPASGAVQAKRSIQMLMGLRAGALAPLVTDSADYSECPLLEPTQPGL